MENTDFFLKLLKKELILKFQKIRHIPFLQTWSNLNETIEKQSNFNWIALEVVSNIIENIENIPEMPSPQYMSKDEFNNFLGE